MSDQELKEVYDTALEYATSLPDANDKARMLASVKEKLDNYQHEVEKSKNNKNTIVATVSAKPHGSFMDRKRGWEEISVTARIRFIGADAEDIEEDLGVDISSPPNR